MKMQVNNFIRRFKPYIQIIVSIMIIIGVIKSYMIGLTFGLELVKNIKDIYILPGGTGFGFGLLFLAVFALGHILSIILILFTIILFVFKTKKIILNKIILFVLAPPFCVQILFIIFCIGTSITKESFSFVKLINTFICLSGSTIQLYFPFFLFLSVINIILTINPTLRKHKEIKNER